MPITLITGPANAGKARELLGAARSHLVHGEEPWLLVPTHADVEHYRRELAQEGAVLGVRVERFEGLIGELVRRAGIGDPVLGRVARERVLAAVSQRPSDGESLADRSSIDRSRSTPGFVSALAALTSELEVQRVSPARLAVALGTWASADGPLAARGAEELGRLYGEYREFLKRIGRSDPDHSAVQALDALRREPAIWGAIPVLMYGFDDFGPLQLDAIETLGVVVGAPVTVSLTFEPGRTAFSGRAGTFETLRPLAGKHRRLEARTEYYAPQARAALHHLERSLFEPGHARADPAGAVRLLEGGGERAELELVAEEVQALLYGGIRPEEIAVVHRTPSSVAELLGEVFAARGVPYALEGQQRFADTAIGGALIGALRSITDEGELGDLLAWLRAPGLLARPELADGLEAKARREGAMSAALATDIWELEHWRLEVLDHLRDAAARDRAGRVGATLAGGQRRRMHGPVTALIERAARELAWLFDAPRRGSAALLEGDELDEARALAAGTRALAELGALANGAPELGVDAASLASVLEGLEFPSGSRAGEGGVAVVGPLALRARRVRALFLTGLQEGVFPASTRPEPLLAEEQRRRLAETSGLRLRGRLRDSLAAERYALYAAVSRPEELLVLSWHAGDDDGVAQARSLFVEDILDLFEEGLEAGRRRRPLGAVDSHNTRARTPSRLGPLREKELRVELREHVWSASSLEAWAQCPVKWFVQRMLRADDLDPEPEPLARGGLAHAALKDTLERLRERTGSARLRKSTLGVSKELMREALAEREAEFPLSAARERRPGLRRRLESDLERYLEHAAEHESPLEPEHLELGFGFEERVGDAEPATGAERPAAPGALAALDLGEGLKLRGRIDRVDVDDGGRQAVVYDYKGRNVSAAARWTERGNVQVALYMRAVEELLHLEAVGGFYQPLSGSDLRARGVLDTESGVQIECVRGELREHADVRALLDEALTTARAAALEAGRGELEPRPRTCAYRGGCMYPTICRCEK